MAHTSVLCKTEEVLAAIGATDALVYRRAAGGRFVLTGPPREDVAGELLLDDEPAVRLALAERVHRVAAEASCEVCGGYRARTAAVVAIDPDVVVVLGRRDGCLAGVGDVELLGAAFAAAAAQAAGV